MSQPLEKVRTQQPVARDTRRVSHRADLRVVPSPVATVPSHVSAIISAERAVLSKPSFFKLKRVIDVMIASVALVALSPLLLLLAAAIKITSKGPVLFRQQRIGRNNVPFTLYKLRSMYVDRQDVSGIAHTVQNDPRVTRVGRYIRRGYIDELPQLINVLKGDMSIVGPRAQVLGMRAVGRSYEELVPNYGARHAVRPGMTGLAQVRGYRGEIKDAEHAFARVDSDLEYIQSVDLTLDLKIMALTVPSVIFGRVDL